MLKNRRWRKYLIMQKSRIEKYIKSYLGNYKDYKNEWNYEDGCILIGVESLYRATGKKGYLDFILKYLDRRIDENGKIAELNPVEYNIDNINSGRVLFTALKETGERKYENAIENVKYLLDIHPRTLEGNFWHKGRYPYQVWLDGLYMAQPFYAVYSNKIGSENGLKDILNQFKNVRKNLFCEEKKLYVHGFDETKTMNWADKKTGKSKNFWGRAIGWYAMALIDVIESVDKPDFGSYRTEFINLFKELMAGVVQYQDESGLWYQVMTLEEREGNYLETSATLMFAYSLLKGSRFGILNENCLEKGKKAFDSVINNNLEENNSIVELKDICIMAGLNGLVPFNGDRDGSFEYYISERVGKDDPKGVGPLMKAYSEIILLENRGGY